MEAVDLAQVCCCCCCSCCCCCCCCWLVTTAGRDKIGIFNPFLCGVIVILLAQDMQLFDYFPYGEDAELDVGIEQVIC